MGDDDQLEVVLTRMSQHQLAQRRRQRLDVLTIQVGRRLVQAKKGSVGRFHLSVMRAAARIKLAAQQCLSAAIERELLPITSYLLAT